MESDLTLHGIKKLTLVFEDTDKERRFKKESLSINVAGFRMLCLLALIVHLIYLGVQAYGGSVVMIYLRIAVCIPSFLVLYYVLSPAILQQNTQLFKYLGYYAIIMTVATQLVFSGSDPDNFTQISHTIPLIIYGTYLFVGLSFRNLLQVINPIVIGLPVIYLWVFMDYDSTQKIHNSVIIFVNAFMAIMAKYHLERVQRINFSEKELQKQQQEKIILTNHELAQQKDLFRGMAERSEDMITIRKMDEVIEYVSPASEKILGYRPGEMIGRKISEFIFEIDQESFKERIKPQINKGEVTTWEARFLHRDGHSVWVQTFGLPITNLHGDVVRVQGSIRDISKKKRAELALQEANVNLKLSNEAKNKFFAIISHDLRGPFNNIVALATLVKEHGLSYTKEEIIRLIENLANSATSARNLLENLLVWSKNQLGGTKLEKRELSLLMIVNSVNSMMAKWAMEKKLKLEVEIDPNFYVYADKDMLSTIFRNLISNAIKFSKEEGRIQIKAMEADNGMADISVIDEGVGIDSKRLEHLFDLDKKVSTKGTSNEVGTGLGLKICKDFVEMNGGELLAESKKEKGTCFRILLPINDKTQSVVS